MIVLRNIPEVWLSYKCVCVIHVYHGDIRAPLRGFNCDIRRPRVRLIPTEMFTAENLQAENRAILMCCDVPQRLRF